jgi:hypothetical protein
MIAMLLMSLCFAAESPPPEVNPTVQYLTEQFQVAIDKGLPLASDGIQELCKQIHYLGIGLLIYDLVFVAFGLGCLAFLYSLLKSFRPDMEDSQAVPRMIGCFLAAISGGIFLMSGFSDISNHITMIVAPTIWALQELI